jgi:hypothetical protein
VLRHFSFEGNSSSVVDNKLRKQDYGYLERQFKLMELGKPIGL